MATNTVNCSARGNALLITPIQVNGQWYNVSIEVAGQNFTGRTFSPDNLQTIAAAAQQILGVAPDPATSIIEYSTHNQETHIRPSSMNGRVTVFDDKSAISANFKQIETLLKAQRVAQRTLLAAPGSPFVNRPGSPPTDGDGSTDDEGASGSRSSTPSGGHTADRTGGSPSKVAPGGAVSDADEGVDEFCDAQEASSERGVPRTVPSRQANAHGGGSGVSPASKSLSSNLPTLEGKTLEDWLREEASHGTLRARLLELNQDLNSDNELKQWLQAQIVDRRTRNAQARVLIARILGADRATRLDPLAQALSGESVGAALAADGD